MDSPTSEKEQLVQFLKNVHPFAELGIPSLARLSSYVTLAEYPSGADIFREGASGGFMCIVKSGKVDIRKKDPGTGMTFSINTCGEGTAFGEISLLTEKPRTATVTAIEPTTVFKLTRADFRKLLVQDPEVSLSLARMLAERLAEVAKQVGIDYVNLSKLNLDPQVLGLLPQAVMVAHKVVPVAFANNSLKLAMVHPGDLMAFDGVRSVIRKGVSIEPVVCTEVDFRRFMDSIYPRISANGEDREKDGAGKSGDLKRKPPVERPAHSLADLEAQILGTLEVQEEQQQAASVSEIAAASEDAPVVRLANNILELAIKKGASDIHIEPQERGLVLRLRIDNVLREETVLAGRIQLPLISRFKILSKLDIAERRMPQDGRISVRIENRAIDFRVSTIPAKFGERIVMRVLDKSQALVDLDRMFVDPQTLEKVQAIIHQPYGIVYITGPTGSGKTTTLYSALKAINTPDINILTAEDPIEYDLAGISQVQIHRDIDLDFARILRAFLRQDPDVILVGETRDRETAKIAVEAALTGHLVFTTLHTNDAPGAFSRLEEMGIEPFLMSSSTLGIIAQRLARRICQNCRVPAEATPETLAYFGFHKDTAPVFYKGEGCERCSNTGYRGRIGIYEVLVMNDELRRMVASGSRTEEIRDAAVRAGMKTMKDYAFGLLSEGLTSVEEVLGAVVVSGQG